MKTYTESEMQEQERTTFQIRSQHYRETAIRKGFPIEEGDIVFGCREYAMSEGTFYGYHVVVKANNMLVRYHKWYKTTTEDLGEITNKEVQQLKDYPYVIDDIHDVLRQLRSGSRIH